MIKLLNRQMTRLSPEDGAVTVDWVVLTASVVALGALVGGVIWNNTSNAALDVATYIGTQKVATGF